MEANFDRCMTQILASEGGFSDDPSDHGGATNLGITQATLAHWRGCPVTADDVRALTADEAKAIYHANYWNSARCGELPGGVDLVVFDVSVNSGPGRAVRMLQEAVGVATDGIFGPATMRAVAAMLPADIVTVLGVQRRGFYQGLVANDPSQGVFLKGWLSRVAAMNALALTMVR